MTMPDSTTSDSELIRNIYKQLTQGNESDKINLLSEMVATLIEQRTENISSKLKALETLHNNTMLTMTDKCNKVLEENRLLKEKLSIESGDDAKGSEAQERDKELSDKLLEMQMSEQKEREKIRNQEKEKLENEYKKKISDMKFQLEKAIADKENAIEDKKQKAKELKLIKDRIKEEIEKGILEKTAALDYTPKVIDACDKIDEVLGAEIEKLNNIYQVLNKKFDDTSIERLYCTYNTVASAKANIKQLLDVPIMDMPDTLDEAIEMREKEMKLKGEKLPISDNSFIFDTINNDGDDDPNTPPDTGLTL